VFVTFKKILIKSFKIPVNMSHQITSRTTLCSHQRGRDWRDQVSIAPTFYVPLLHAEIPKVQKYSQAVSLFMPLGSARVKPARKMLMKLTTED